MYWCCQEVVAPSLLPPAVLYPPQSVPLSPSIRLSGVLSTLATVFIVDPGAGLTRLRERNLPCAQQYFGVLKNVLREQMKMGETKKHMTRSVVAHLGCLLSPLLCVSFSSTPQPDFPHHGASHKNWDKMPLCLMCGPRTNSWSGGAGEVFLLWDPAAKGGEKTPGDGQRRCLGPGAVLICSDSCDVNFHLVSPIFP